MEPRRKMSALTGARFVYILLWTLVTVSSCTADEEAFAGSVSRERRAVAAAQNKKLRVVTIEHPPYMFINKISPDRIQYSGFLVDLMEQLKTDLKIEYEFYPVSDNKYGTLIKDVAARKYTTVGNDSDPVDDSVGADIAAAPLTITPERAVAVDFVHPFHHIGVSLLIKKAYMKQNATIGPSVWPFVFGIFRPMSAAVWGLIFVTVIIVGVLLSLMNHFNPYEWGGRYNLGLATTHHREAFNLSGSLWFVFSTLQWQGFERAPRSNASKVLTCFWFFFVTLTLVTYTGALVNNLWWASMAQKHNPTKHIATSVADLINGAHGQGDEFALGCIEGGSTYRFLTEVLAPKKVEFQMLKMYWDHPFGNKQLVKSVKEGLEKVRNENFAFFCESLEAKYYMNKKPCDITTLGEDFGSKSFGLAVPKNSPYREMLNTAIISMITSGTLDDIERKWWEGQGECWNYTFIEAAVEKRTQLYISSAQPKVIDLEMFWGPLVTMLIGVLLSLAVAVAEIIYYRYKGRYHESNRPQGQTLNLDHEDANI